MSEQSAAHSILELPLVVVGIGSPASCDDAVGLKLVEQLAARGHAAIETQQWQDADALTLAHNLLELNRPVVLVDCADMGLAPGAWSFFSADDVVLSVNDQAVSVHGIGLSDALGLVKNLGHVEPVWFFGVQPYDLQPALSMSDEMEYQVPLLLMALEMSVIQLITPKAVAHAV